MVEIKDLIVKENNIKESKKYKEVLELIKLGGGDEKMIPTGKSFIFYCKLHDTYTSIANGLRRCIQDEISIQSMSITSMSSDDEYLTLDRVSNQISSIPIKQDIKYDNIKISLDFENKTKNIVSIFTKDLDIKGTNKKIFGDTTIIIRIRPFKKLRISNIKIIQGKKIFSDCASFETVANILYWPLRKKEECKKSALLVNPTSFELGYTTYRYSVDDPFYYIVKGCSNLINRLTNILEEIKLVKYKKNYTISHSSNLLNITSVSNEYRFMFNNEYWTIAMIISQGCYMEYKDIEFTSPSIEHPSEEKGIVVIKHPQPLKLIEGSINRALKEYEKILGFVSKKK